MSNDNSRTEIQSESEFRGAETPSWKLARKVLLVLGILAAFILTAFLLWFGADVMLLVFAGLLLAIFFRLLSDFLSSHSPLSDKLALAVVLFGIIGLIALGGWLLSDSVQNQFEELSEQLPVAFAQLSERLAQYPFGRRIIEQIPPPQQIILGRQSANVFGRVTGFFSTALNFATDSLIVLMTAVYFAFNPKLYREGVIKLVPQNYEQRAREILATIEFTLRRFLLGISVSMTINGTLTFLGLWFLDVPFAIPLGIIAGILTFIPNIGPIIAAAPAVLIAFSQSPAQALYVLILYLIVQNLDGFIITPLIQHRAISLPPVMVIASQLLLAVIFGFLGLLVAVPLFSVIFVAVKMIYVEGILGRKIEVKGEDKAQEKASRQKNESEKSAVDS